MFNGKKYNIILMIVYRFTKYTLYILTTKQFTIKSFITLFFKYIFRFFKLPDNIISDKNNLFTSKFWSIFYYYFTMKRQLNIIFYLQTDSQIEKLNQLLEHYLRNYYNFEQDNWATKLFLAEFVYNTSWHLSTGTTPASALLRFDPKGPTDLPAPMKTGRTPTAKDRTKQLRDNKENV